MTSRARRTDYTPISASYYFEEADDVFTIILRARLPEYDGHRHEL